MRLFYVTVVLRACSIYFQQHSKEEAGCAFPWHMVNAVNKSPTRNKKGCREGWLQAVLSGRLSNKGTPRKHEGRLLFCPWRCWRLKPGLCVQARQSRTTWLDPSSRRLLFKVRTEREKQPRAKEQASTARDEWRTVKSSCSAWKQRKAGQKKKKQKYKTKIDFKKINLA